ncbi:MAG: alpha/beta hydrolase [Armatimonadetes bacterium]|nr:alpha/beta hydrolase [Armatimonadota bacterium]
MNDELFLILHGWGGNKPAHWQEHLYKTLTDAGKTVHYPKMPEPTAPNKEAWLAKLAATFAEIGDTNLTVVCHSLGAITWLHYVAQSSGKLAERVLLVAPPYVIREIPPTDAPPDANEFFPPTLDAEAVKRAATETHFIASDSDDYATFEQTKAYSDRVNCPIHLLPGAGHISPYWGYGQWEWVEKWCLREAELPPVPRPADAT